MKLFKSLMMLAAVVGLCACGSEENKRGGATPPGTQSPAIGQSVVCSGVPQEGQLSNGEQFEVTFNGSTQASVKVTSSGITLRDRSLNCQPNQEELGADVFYCEENNMSTPGAMLLYVGTIAGALSTDMFEFLGGGHAYLGWLYCERR